MNKNLKFKHSPLFSLKRFVIRRLLRYKKALLYLACILIYIGGGIIMENHLHITEPSIYAFFGGVIGVVLGNISNSK